MTLLVLSPHLDDAVLDCADHIREWQGAGASIRVVTLFTECGAGEPSEYMRTTMGGADGETFGRMRRQEDEEAMKAMKVHFAHAGLLDAGFRRTETGRLLYPDYRALTPRRIPAFERRTIEETKTFLATLPIPDQVLLPLGVGRHVDHQIARRAATEVWNGRSRIGFYVEFPYGLRPWKYRLGMVGSFLGRRISIKPFSKSKMKLVETYRTQVPFLFRRPPKYPEILLLPRKQG